MMINNILNNRYKIVEKVSEGGMSIVYKGFDKREKKEVAIKVLKKETISNRIEDFIHFRSESAIISKINHNNIIKIYGFGDLINKEKKGNDFVPYIIMEFINGDSLSILLKKGMEFLLEDKIKILIAISEALEYIHSHGIIHRDLKASNVMVMLNDDKDELKIKIIDFGLAQVKEFTRITDVDEIVGTFGYMSPEQSGMIKRNVDERSDLYSFGILSYQLLTGILPYQGKDISSIMHQHIAKKADPLFKFNNDIPEILDRIILKLIEKEPEKRYQSAKGLLRDLRRYQNGETNFELGTEDRGIKLRYQTELIGREEELIKLKSLFDKARKGNGGLCFISGEAGKGKTRLVNELRNYIYTVKGIFLEGKCFSGENKIPYLVFKDALDMYLKMFDNYSPDKKREIQNKMKDVVGELGEIILRINPLMKEVIGECPALVSLEREKENQRFLSVSSKFFQGLSRIEGGLVILLDDLQWVEEGSLLILNEIVKDIINVPLLIIGNYRDNEISVEHRFQKFTNYIKGDNKVIEDIKLSNFDCEMMNKFVAGILFDKEENVKEISDFILNKSKGNPFFCIEILRLLVDSKVIEREEGRWYINNDLLNRLEFSETIVEALLKRISLLRENEKELLSYASLIGRKFDIDILFDVLQNYEKEDVVNIIDKAIGLQLLELDFTEKGKILFVHERIKEAFEKIVDEIYKKQIHLKIASNIEEKYKEEIKKSINDFSLLFELVNHYIYAENDRKILEYAYPAGIKAQKSYANEEAIRYFSIVIKLSEGINNKLVINSKKNVSEIYLVIGKYDEAIELSKEILQYEEINLEKAKIYKQITHAYFKKGNWDESEKYAKIGLKILGENLPIKKMDVILGVLKECIIYLIYSLLSFIFVRKKSNPKSEKYKLIIWYYYAIDWVYALSDTLKMLRSILRMKNISESKIGVSEEMTISYGAFGGLLMVIAFFKKAECFYKKAINISEISNYQWILGVNYQLLSISYSWEGKYKKCIECARKSIDIFNKIGDSRELGFSLNLLIQGYYSLSSYTNALNENATYFDISDKSSNNYGCGTAYANYQKIYLEIGDYVNCEKFGIKNYDLSLNYKIDFINSMASIYLGYLYYEQKFLEKSLYYLHYAKELNENNNFLKHYSVNLYPILSDLYIELYENNINKNEKITVKMVKKMCKYSLKATKKWITHYGHALRVNAKYLVLVGKNKKAERCFLKSIEQCRKISRKYEEAKGYYEYGLFLNNINRKEEARFKWEKAYQIFKEIDSKVYLKKTAGLLGLIEQEQKDEETSIQRLQYKQKLSSVIAISQDISLILDINVLIERILDKAMEVTGAQEGLIFLFNEKLNKLEYKTGKNVSKEDEVLKFSKSIVEKVYENGEIIITTNAGEDIDLIKFESVRSYGLKSILCLPIIFHEKKIGVCYLDNPLSTHVFIDEDVELLKVFMSQAAISIENTRMYQALENLNKNLEEKVEDRTSELKIANKQLKEASEQKTQFFLNIAHETKTPLTLIKNYFDLYIKKTGFTKELTIIKQNLDKLLRDMDNFLHVEKLKENQIYYNHEQIVDFSDIIKKKIILFIKAAKKKNITITNHSPSKPICIKGDPYAIDSIINNLIDNAIKYTEEFGKIKITLEKKDDELIFIVQDNGIGIPEEQLSNIFKPFHQILNKKKNIQGIGMGLFIVYKIVESLNGNIKVESKPNEGSRFIITLKIYTPKEFDHIQKDIYLSQPQSIYPPKIEFSEKMYNPQNDSLFIVEDNLEMLNYLVSELQKYYNVFFAKNGKLAISKLREIPKPDIIISDIMMDEMDGIEFFKSINTMERYQDIPFIFLTVKSNIQDKLAGLKAGAIDYIFKPFLMDELLLKINSILINLKKQRITNINVIEKSLKQKLSELITKPDRIEYSKTDNLEQTYEKYKITYKEKKILELVLHSYQNKEICGILNISMKTVETHLYNIYRKFGIKNRIELFHFLKI